MRILSLTLGISLSMGAAFAQYTALPIIVNLPVVGLASSETAQVDIMYLPQPTLAVLPANAAPSSTQCTGTITFYSASGSAIGSPTPFSITIGQIFSATLPYSQVEPGDPPPTGNGRTAIRAAITTSAGLCTINTNIETYDTATGVTHVHVEGPSTGIFPNVRLGPAR